MLFCSIKGKLSFTYTHFTLEVTNEVEDSSPNITGAKGSQEKKTLW
jgi:hypothetical protein